MFLAIGGNVQMGAAKENKSEDKYDKQIQLAQTDTQTQQIIAALDAKAPELKGFFGRPDVQKSSTFLEEKGLASKSYSRDLVEAYVKNIGNKTEQALAVYAANDTPRRVYEVKVQAAAKLPISGADQETLVTTNNVAARYEIYSRNSVPAPAVQLFEATIRTAKTFEDKKDIKALEELNKNMSKIQTIEDLKTFMVSHGYEKEFRSILNQVTEVMQQLSFANDLASNPDGGASKGIQEGQRIMKEGFDKALYVPEPISYAAEANADDVGLAAIKPKKIKPKQAS